MKLPFTKVAPFYFTTLQRWVPQALGLLLTEHVYREIRPEQSVSTGFVHAIDEGELVETLAPGTVYLRYKITEKKVPKKVLWDAMQPAIKAWEEANGGGKIPRPEQLTIQEECYNELIKVAFPVDKVIDVILTPEYALIGDPSWKRAELVLNELRAALGSLPVRPLCGYVEFQDLMTNRLLGHGSSSFGLGDRFQAKNVETKAEVKGNHVEVNRDEFLDLVTDGMKVVEMEMTYRHEDDATATWFVLKKDGILKAVIYPPELSDMAAEDAGEDHNWATMLRATLLLIQSSLRQLVDVLARECGGLVFGEGKTAPEPPTGQLAAALMHFKERMPSGVGATSYISTQNLVREAMNAVLDDVTGGGRVTAAEVDEILARLRQHGGAPDPDDSDPDDEQEAEPEETKTDTSDVDSLI